MKKKTLLLLLPLLASCTSTGSGKLDLATTLEAFKQGIKVDVTLTETRNNETKTYYLTNTSKEREFSFIQYKDETKLEKALHEYYVSSTDEYVYATRLNVANEYTLYEVYNPATYDYYTWEEGYNNAFLELSSDDFSKVDDKTYTLLNTSEEKVSDEISTLIYGNPGLTLTSLTISKENNDVSLSGSMEYLDTYVYEFNAVVISSGASTTCDPRSPLFEEVSDSIFETMLTSLKNNNFTMTVKNYDDGLLDYTSYLYSDETSVIFETVEATYGYYTVDEENCQEVYKNGDNFYKVGEPEEGSLDELRIPFEISRSCFDYKDGIYTLKAGVEGSIYTVTLLESYVEELDEFTIEVSSDSYTFLNVSGDYATEIIISDIGTTDTGVNEESVLEPVAAATWEDVLNPSTSFSYILEVAGEEAYNIPVPENYNYWNIEYMQEEITCVLLTAEGSSTIDDDLANYGEALIDAEYQIYEEEGWIFGGTMFIKGVEVNNEEHVLVVEVFDYYGMFGIAIYIAE